jgi:hypothetical protein
VNAREEEEEGLDQTFNRATGRARRKTLDNIFFLLGVCVYEGKSDGREVGQDPTYAMLELSVKHGKRGDLELSRITRVTLSSGSNLDCIQQECRV